MILTLLPTEQESLRAESINFLTSDVSEHPQLPTHSRSTKYADCCYVYVVSISVRELPLIYPPPHSTHTHVPSPHSTHTHVPSPTLHTHSTHTLHTHTQTRVCLVSPCSLMSSVQAKPSPPPSWLPSTTSHKALDWRPVVYSGEGRPRPRSTG